jgi:hypothetical protein
MILSALARTVAGRSVLLVVLAGACVIAACGGSGTGPGSGANGGQGLGTFHAIVTGVVSDTLDGPARFEIYPATNTCALIFDGSSSANGISVTTPSDSRPAVGQLTHAAASNPPTDFDATYLDHPATVIGYSADGGTIGITKSTAAELAGSFSFSAHQTYPSEDGARTVSANGTFRATPGQTPCK